MVRIEEEAEFKRRFLCYGIVMGRTFSRFLYVNRFS